MPKHTISQPVSTSGKLPKICFVAPYYAPKLGGLENYVQQTAKQLKTLGWQVVVVTSNHRRRELDVEDLEGVRVYRLPATLHVSNTPLGLMWLPYIRKIFREERPDVINAHTPVPGLADIAAQAAGKVPFVLTYHAATLYKESGIVNAAVAMYKVAERRMLKKATKIIVVSPYQKRLFPSRLKQKLVLIENAIPKAIIRKPQPTKRTGADRVVFVSNLHKAHAWKGLDDILDAALLCSGLYVDVVGDGDHKAHYQARVEALGISDRVIFHGAQIGSAKDELIAKASALVCYPKSEQDAFPTVILEAWALGTPLVAARIGAMPDIIKDKHDGVLVPPHNPAALAKALKSLFQDRTLQEQLAANGTKRAQDYTWEGQAIKTDKLLRELI